MGLGFPYPESIALASLLESVVRANGGIPATIGVLNGVARVGMDAEELIELASTAEKKNALKVSRRDLGYICGLVCEILGQAILNRKLMGVGSGWKTTSWRYDRIRDNDARPYGWN